MIDGPVRKSCQKFVYSFVNNERHEKDDTIDGAENNRDFKSRLVIRQLKISASPRNVHKQKIAMRRLTLLTALNSAEASNPDSFSYS